VLKLLRIQTYKELCSLSINYTLTHLHISLICFRHARLLSLLNKFRDSISGDTKFPVAADTGVGLTFSTDLVLNKVCKWSLLTNQCFQL